MHRAAYEAGIEVRGSFILGLPGETPEMGQKTLDFALTLDLDYGQFNLVSPFQGTEMYDECKDPKNGTFDDGGDYSNYHIAGLIFLPKDYQNKDQLLKLRDQAYKKFYFRPKYWKLKLKQINSFEDIVRYWRGLLFFLDVRVINSGKY